MGCTGSDLSEDQSLLANVLQLRVEDIRKLFGVFVHICEPALPFNRSVSTT
jgi:hypothetical protein